MITLNSKTKAYLYDGSFDGLLTCIYDAFYLKENPIEIISEHAFVPDLIKETFYIETRQADAEKVYNATREKISNDAAELIYYVYLSDLPGSGILILKYLRIGFKMGSNTNLNLQNEIVLKMFRIRNKVALEAHRILGFIRFKKISKEIYYAPFEPDHNIIALISDHFSNRLSDQNWIIHDLKREIAVFYNRNEWVISPFSKKQGAALFSYNEESKYEKLWRTYFSATAITERKNINLQRNHMPKRYWKHLTEIE